LTALGPAVKQDEDEFQEREPAVPCRLQRFLIVEIEKNRQFSGT
jgi:hypothetical protein